MTITVRVALGGRGYDILIGTGRLAEAGGAIAAAVGRRRLVVVTDETLARLHLPALLGGLAAAGYEPLTVVVPPGEDQKSFDRLPALAERILALGIDRRTVLIAFGGGVIGDLTGFLAAILLRGLDFVQIPTTLLAQIDSSVGGKTGCNTGHGKNLVGAFHQPRLVLADLDVLSTLPRREWLAGYAEMAKYGLIGDAAFFERLERSAPLLLDGADPAGLADAIAHCCRMKAEIVAADEREAGQRALLNLGHTFGHALEAETGFGPALLHGEAVGVGMVLAARLSVDLGLLSKDAAERIGRHLDAVGLPVALDRIAGHPFSAERLVAHMAHDKKALDGRLNFVLLDAIGRARLVDAVDPAVVRETLLDAGAA